MGPRPHALRVKETSSFLCGDLVNHLLLEIHWRSSN